ncbi:hypothetical protein DFH27DRAFT_9655 [Peziza echinospora]|nr:hypothetical protein DFH27DRAFT_9655 [Peziza echinospora]
MLKRIGKSHQPQRIASGRRGSRVEAFLCCAGPPLALAQRPKAHCPAPAPQVLAGPCLEQRIPTEVAHVRCCAVRASRRPSGAVCDELWVCPVRSGEGCLSRSSSPRNGVARRPRKKKEERIQGQLMAAVAKKHLPMRRAPLVPSPGRWPAPAERQGRLRTAVSHG